MKTSAVTTNHNVFESQVNNTNKAKCLRPETLWSFNVGAGLIILFALFSIFTLINVFILDVLAFEINIFPVALTVMLFAAAGISVFIVSHAFQLNT